MTADATAAAPLDSLPRTGGGNAVLASLGAALIAVGLVLRRTASRLLAS